jgi:hypothetical protein
MTHAVEVETEDLGRTAKGVRLKRARRMTHANGGRLPEKDDGEEAYAEDAIEVGGRVTGEDSDSGEAPRKKGAARGSSLGHAKKIDSRRLYRYSLYRYR